MWRDRTNLFVFVPFRLSSALDLLTALGRLPDCSYVSYRQSFVHHPRLKIRGWDSGTAGLHSFGAHSSNSYDKPEDRRGLLSSGAFENVGDTVIEMDLLPPRCTDASGEILELLGEIAAKSQRLEKLHQKHILPRFNDGEAKLAEEAQIEKVTQEITRGFHECHERIRRIEQTARESKDSGRLIRAEEIMAKNIQISLAHKVQDASASFRRIQSIYLKKLRDMGGFASARSMERTSTPQPGSYVSPSLQGSDADRLDSQSMFQVASQQKQVHINDAAISHREREIEEIAQGINRLSDLFRELQTIVIDQGTMLDRIDFNVERMNQSVESADMELKVATGFQRRTMKRKVILLLTLLIAGLLILLCLKPRRNGSSKH